MKKKPSPIQETVMEKISTGQVRMHSRLYYSLITLAMIGIGLAGGVLLAYVVNIATYIIRIQAATTPAYGARSNLASSLASFPWGVLFLAVACIALAVWLMRRYGRAYRHTLIAIIATFFLASVALGIGLSFMDLGDHSDEQNMRGRGSHIER